MLFNSYQNINNIQILFMSYKIISLKYRPQLFEEVVGQQPVLKAITHSLHNNNIHHAYLFTGTRGIGKTSIARIFAKAISCLRGISDQPCQQCNNCQSIEKAKFIDLIEIDGASKTKVEDTRSIIENAQYMPIVGRFKIFLIDEVHMLSRSSFNALLKTLEEPPKHVKFLLATTDPEKIPLTVISRCLKFNLRSLKKQDIVKQLSNILKKENVAYDTKSIQLIAHAADGSMRDALNITEQAIAYSNNNIQIEFVQSMLGLINEEITEQLISAIIDNNPQKIIELNEKIVRENKNPIQVINNVAECLYEANMYNVNNTNINYTYGIHILEKITSNLSAAKIYEYYQFIIKAKKILHLSPTYESGLNMTLLYLCCDKKKHCIDPSLPEKKINKDNYNTVNNDNWSKIRNTIKIKGIESKILLSSSFISMVDNTLTIKVPNTMRNLMNEMNKKSIEIALQEIINTKVHLKYTHEKIIKSNEKEVGDDNARCKSNTVKILEDIGFSLVDKNYSK